MRFRFLDDEQITGIHDAALYILDSVGMQVDGDGPKHALIDAGAREKDGRILIPPGVVGGALLLAPPDGFTLTGRDPDKKCVVKPGIVNFRPAGGLPFTLDYPSGTRRQATMQDAERIVRVVDALDGFAIANSAVSPADIGVGIRNVLRFVNSIRNSTKPSDVTASGPDEIAAVAEIAAAIRGGNDELIANPMVMAYISPTSPMRLSEGEALAVMECAERGIPLAPLSCPTLAATAPATMAGGIAMQWAEELAMIVLAYAVRPGLPIMACSRVNPVDMRTGTTIMAGATPGLMTAAFADVAARFNLATNGWGFATSSHAADLQAGAERAIGALQAAQAGVSVVSGGGTLGDALISTPEQLVLDNELIGIVREACAGVEVNVETLAMDYLAEGTAEGTFLASEHTIDHLRDYWMADVFVADPYETWRNAGKSLMDRATDRVNRILCEHTTPPIDPALDKEIDRILAAAGIEN